MKKSLIALIVLASNLIIPLVQAAEWSLTSTLNPSVKYDDNVFMSEKKQSSVQHAISPTVTIKREVEASQLSLVTGYNIDRYVAFNELDRDDPFIRLESGFSTERSQYDLLASYEQKSSRSIAEQDTGDFNTESTVTTKTLLPSYSYQLTEYDSLYLSAAYTTRSYSTADFNDNETISLNSAWQHLFSDRLSAGLAVSVSNYQSDGLTVKTDDDNYSLSTVLNYQLTELWQFSGQIGLRKLNSSSSSNGLNETNSSSGSLFNFNVSKKTEFDTLSLDVSRSLSPTSLGDVNEQDSLRFQWSRDITENLSSRLSASYQQTISATDEGNDERENLNLSPSIKWQFERNLGIDLSYNYRQQKNSSDDTDVNSNSVMVSLIYDWDGYRISR